MSARQTSTNANAVTKAPQRAIETRSRGWDPLGLMTEMQAEMERLFGRSSRQMIPGSAVHVPRMDIYEKDDAIMVEAELPGVKKEDLEVAIEDGDLVLRGEAKSESNVQENDYYRMERNYGRFYRHVPLPDGVDSNKIEACFDDGVLRLKVPKPTASKSEPKKIPIK